MFYDSADDKCSRGWCDVQFVLVVLVGFFFLLGIVPSITLLCLSWSSWRQSATVVVRFRCVKCCGPSHYCG